MAVKPRYNLNVFSGIAMISNLDSPIKPLQTAIGHQGQKFKIMLYTDDFDS